MRKYTNVYRGEDEPKVKDVLWIHHSKYNDLQSGIIAKVYSKGKWVSLNSSDDSNSGTGGGLVIHGNVVESDDNNSFHFIPDSGEPSFSDAANAFLSGRPVIGVEEVYQNGVLFIREAFTFDYYNEGPEGATLTYLKVNNSYYFWDRDYSPNNSGSEEGGESSTK